MMEQIVQTQPPKIHISDYRQAWEMVSGQLRMEMSRALFETYVQPLEALGYQNGIFRLGAYNPYTREWVENRLTNLIGRQMEGLLNQPVNVQIELRNDFQPSRTVEKVPEIESDDSEVQEPPSRIEGNGKNGTRKLALQRAYGSKRAAVIQPERTLFITQYFFNNWLELIGHSAFTVILAARSMCYWNPISGELRNEIDTEMSELAQRAAVSVRTVKTVLNHELVKRYFLRYKARRVMTPNGVRTAGIMLQVRMDDPLTPEDQAKFEISEDDLWYSPEFVSEDDSLDE
jgi:hypothetical protein